MTVTQKGWNQKLMASFYAKETTYGATVTVNATNWSGIKGHADFDPDWADEVVTNKEEVTGTEHGTDLDIITQGFKLGLSQPKAKPNFVVAAVGGALGSLTATQEPGRTAYAFKALPVAVGTALPSFNLIGVKGGTQYLHTGCMVNSVSLTMEEGKPVSCEIDIIGSGSRTTNADSFIDEPSESWIMMKNGYAWIETGADISISAENTQGSEDISSSTPEDIKAIIKKATWKWNNNLAGQFGYGAENSGVFQGMDYGRRSQDLSLTLLHSGATDLQRYIDKTVMALEIEVKGAAITAGGTMYYGYSLRIPRFKLKKAALPKGGVGDILTVDYECDVQDDGTNSAVIFHGYTSKTTYYA